MVDHTLAEGLEAVRRNKSRTGSLIAEHARLKTRVEELIRDQGTMSPEMQAGINEIFDTSEEAAKQIDDALNTGVPAPTPTPV